MESEPKEYEYPADVFQDDAGRPKPGAALRTNEDYVRLQQELIRYAPTPAEQEKKVAKLTRLVTDKDARTKHMPRRAADIERIAIRLWNGYITPATAVNQIDEWFAKRLPQG